jgi:hypothetical protein
LLAGAAGALPDFASAQGDYPNHAITMVVPFPPGGPTDVVARLLCERLGRALKQAVIIENRPGANANIGTGAVAKAPADGYTVLYNTSSIVMSPALYRSLPYDLNRDFVPVALTATVPLALVVVEAEPLSLPVAEGDAPSVTLAVGERDVDGASVFVELAVLEGVDAGLDVVERNDAADRAGQIQPSQRDQSGQRLDVDVLIAEVPEHLLLGQAEQGRGAHRRALVTHSHCHQSAAEKISTSCSPR